MLIRTGRGSISFVAGCCWVNAVNRSATSSSFPTAQQPEPGRKAVATGENPLEPLDQPRGGSNR